MEYHRRSAREITNLSHTSRYNIFVDHTIMKVYFTASLRGVQFFGQYYKRIYDQIVEMGYASLDQDIFKLKSSKFYSDQELKGHKAHTEFYLKKIQRIQVADVCIFETSLNSLSVGYQVMKALQYHKPTILLYLKDNVPYFIEGIEHEKLIVRSYTDTTLQKVLSECLELSHKKREQRFNFFINTELLNYLEGASKKSGLTKSVYIRNLIAADRIKKTSR